MRYFPKKPKLPDSPHTWATDPGTVVTPCEIHVPELQSLNGVPKSLHLSRFIHLGDGKKGSSGGERLTEPVAETVVTDDVPVVVSAVGRSSLEACAGCRTSLQHPVGQNAEMTTR